jgi:glycosyltransferase involved in cell wall biosynthesis
MAVRDGEPYVRDAIESVLSQSVADFEFLIVDDGSTDRTSRIVASYRDSRIRLTTMDRNVGLSAALNEGVRLAQAPLVARQDADDVSEPIRLERQVAAMNARPELALLGSQAVEITQNGVATGTVRRPMAPASMRWFSVFDNPFIHTSVVFRAEVVRALGGFDAAFDPFSQDYDLWCRVMEEHAVANLPDRLLRYRVSGTSILGSLDADTAKSDYRRRFERIERELTTRQARRVFGPGAISDEEAPLLAGLVLGLDPAEIDEFLSLFERLLSRYRMQEQDCDSADFRRTLARQFDALVARVTPASRGSTGAILAHMFRQHPELAAWVSWPRALAALVFGGTGRHRLAAWRRRLAATKH